MVRNFAAGFGFLAVTLLGSLPALADDAPAKPEVIEARPPIWHIKGRHGGVATLFGSLHMLPANTDWLTPDILHDIRHTNVFVFETATDARARIVLDNLTDTYGKLPEGETLRGLLPPDFQSDYDAAISSAHLSSAITDREQPWLVSLQLTLADSMNKGYYPDAGVDYVLMSWANSKNREVRYLETVDQQFRMLVPSDGNSQLDQFESYLKNAGQKPDDLDPLMTAWSQGDIGKLETLMDDSFATDPAAKKILVTDRNKNWAAQIEKMLNEYSNFFITVGVAHVTGPDGVPALLRADGYEVDGP